MIDTTNLVKTDFGEFVAIGSKPEHLQDLDFSLFNFGGINSTELLNLGDETIFCYLLVTKQNYIKARAKNIVTNLKWNYKGKNGKLPWGLAVGQAIREFNSIKTEKFLSHSSFFDNEQFIVDQRKQSGYIYRNEKSG